MAGIATIGAFDQTPVEPSFIGAVLAPAAENHRSPLRIESESKSPHPAAASEAKLFHVACFDPLSVLTVGRPARGPNWRRISATASSWSCVLSSNAANSGSNS
jgi:hypothetical protein